MLTRRWLPAVILTGGLTASVLAGDPVAKCACKDATPPPQQCSARCVGFECRVFNLSDSFFEDPEGFDPRGKSMLSAEELGRFLTAVQSDPGSQIVVAPKITVIDGAEAKVRVGEARSFTTQVRVERAGGLEHCVPCVGSFNLGLGMAVTPHVLPGGQGIQLDCHAEWSQTASDRVPLFPVTTFITPVLEGRRQGPPIPFTLFLQEPTIQTRSAFAAKTIQPGGTVLIDLGRSEREVERKKCFPVLSELPLIGEMFQSTEYVTEASHMIVCLTPRVEDAAAAPTAVCPPSYASDAGSVIRLAGGLWPPPRMCSAPRELVLAQCDAVAMSAAPAMDADAAKKLAFHLDCYRRACAAGLKDEAVEHAHRCLEIDPGCFMKPTR